MKKSELLNYQLYTWYEHNKRILPWRETDDAYSIWVSEIILQQTRVEQGLPYYMRFIERFPTLVSLAQAKEDEVLRYWQGLGYYSRARNIYKAARQLIDNHYSSFPSTFEEIRSLPGVGDYTAGAIAAFAYNLPYPALDGNVYRVLARLTDCEIPFDTSAGKSHFHRVAEELLDRSHPRLFDSALMEFGALFCVPISPDCTHTIQYHYCPYVSQDRRFVTDTSTIPFISHRIERHLYISVKQKIFGIIYGSFHLRKRSNYFLLLTHPI